MTKVFVDSTIPMYAAGQPHPHREPSLRFLTTVHHQRVTAFSSAEVLQEILHRYNSIRRADLAESVYRHFVAVCPDILDVTLAETDRALELLRNVSGISARDALHAAVMLNHGIRTIVTFDADFDRIPGIERIEPR